MTRGILLLACLLAISYAATMTCAWGKNSNISLTQDPYFTCAPLAYDTKIQNVESFLTVEEEVVENNLYADTVTFLYDIEHKPANTRKVKIAIVRIGTLGVGSHNASEQMIQAKKYLNIAGESGIDIALLPEEFSIENTDKAEGIPGPTTNAIRKIAAKYNMYIICPIWEAVKDANTGLTSYYNTAVLIDRKGEIIGTYRKYFPFWGGGIRPPRNGIPYFDLDFGRISILTCYDLNFPEIFQQAAANNVDIVFWPSAYGGGPPLKAYAAIHHYHMVANGWGWFIDMTGATIEPETYTDAILFTATFDLDRTLVHKDFNYDKVSKLLQENPDIVIECDFTAGNWWAIRSKSETVSAREMLEKYEIEPLRHYQQRSRREINLLRRTGGHVFDTLPSRDLSQRWTPKHQERFEAKFGKLPPCNF